MHASIRFLFLVGLFAIACQPSAEQAETVVSETNYIPPFRPNILWLVAEDLGSYIPPFGDSTVQTPTLSRLAAEGVRYTHVFSPSGVCAPSRAALATGMYPTHIGANNMRTGPWYSDKIPEEQVKAYAQYLPPGLTPYEAVPPPEVKMHGEYLRAAGYYCTNNSKEDYQFRKSPLAWDESSNEAHWRKRPAGKPFFSIFNFGVTHESQIWARAKDSLWVDPNLPIPVPPYLPDNEVGRRDVRQMYSNIKTMDYQVGEILDQLEADGLLDSTIVVWYTDHGGPLPRQKRLLYDSGLEVPMIIRFPNKWHAGETDDQLISFIDFLPTLLSLIGEKPPAYLDGQAFLGEFATAEPRRYIHAAADRFDEKSDMIRAVRDQRYKYLRNFHPEQGYYLPLSYREQMPVMQELLRLRDAGELTPEQAQWFRSSKPEEELFDTQTDPHELRNLADDPAYADKLKELRQECNRWMEAIDDNGRMTEAELIETLWPGGIQPVTAPPVISEKEGKVFLSSQTEGASLGYKIMQNGAEPTAWTVYTGPFVLPDGAELKTVAHRLGFAPAYQ